MLTLVVSVTITLLFKSLVLLFKSLVLSYIGYPFHEYLLVQQSYFVNFPFLRLMPVCATEYIP